MTYSRWVDFEKAFDSVNWEFLDSVISQMGFTLKWRMWIRGCLKSVCASVLINGSPTCEFEIKRGLRQGDPLSPFLFLLVAEALNITLQDAVTQKIFHGISVSNEVTLSHLQFADDALIMGTWSIDNARNLSRLLNCFHLASGLKVNYSKSKLFGIGVPTSEITYFSSILGCQAASFPTTYLGLPIGSNMKRCSSWNDIILKFQKKLSSWKSKSLSYGGRLTLIKSVLGSLATYYFSIFKVPKKVLEKLEGIRRKFFWGETGDKKKVSWVAWDKILAPKSKGGLGIGSLMSANYAMLSKWWWQFKVEPEALWSKVIKSLYGNDGGLLNWDNSQSGTWNHILSLNNDLAKLNIQIHQLFKKQVGNGESTSFWNDMWVGNFILKAEYPRLFSLETDKNAMVSQRFKLVNGKWDHSWSWRRPPRLVHEIDQLLEINELTSNFALSSAQYSWNFTLGSNRVFTVRDIRKHISNHLHANLHNESHPKWNPLLPIKVNLLKWHILLQRLPTRCSLAMRNIYLESIMCPMCGNHTETELHIFSDCTIAVTLWEGIARWWGLPTLSFNELLEIPDYHLTADVPDAYRSLLDVVMKTTLWVIWTHRNKVAFNSNPGRLSSLGDEIKVLSFLWINSRSHIFNLDWFGWICKPTTCITIS